MDLLTNYTVEERFHNILFILEWNQIVLKWHEHEQGRRTGEGCTCVILKWIDFSTEIMQNMIFLLCIGFLGAL